ncbi:MAG: class I SAM-dependent methyltransferase [Anaerolineae bacterium]
MEHKPDFDLVARFYDGEYAAFDVDIPMYQAFAERTGGPLLDLGAGTGRVAVALAQAGFEVTGVDGSAAMLEIARRKAEEAGVSHRVRWVQAPMESFSLETRFHMAFCAINSFMHLETLEQQLTALRCWHRHLRPGGLLILDLFPPDPDLLDDEGGALIVHRVWDDPETGAKVIKQYTRQVDLAQQQMHLHFIYDEVFPDGSLRRTVFPFTMRYLGRFEAELLLEKAGFVVEDVYGSWDLDPFDVGSERMIFVARRDVRG